MFFYRHVDDIDFFVGGISERPVAGGLLGWTFLCVVGDQFARVKKGDRFFYDLGGQPSSFTPGKCLGGERKCLFSFDVTLALQLLLRCICIL